MPRKERRRNESRLTVGQILNWADRYREKHGTWPHTNAGPVDGTTETWKGVNFALYRGRRGLKGKSSLTKLLRAKRGVIVRRDPLDEDTIVQWAQAHFQRTGRWPTCDGGTIPEAPDEKWSAVNEALAEGRRGLPGGSSLSKLLADHGARRTCRTQLDPQSILAWADSYFAAAS